jgi:surface protein
MVGMFYNCISLTTLDLSSFDTNSVESMENMFFGAKSLKSLDLSNFVLTSINNMKKMFYNCTSLIFLNLKNFGVKKENLVVNDIFSDNLKHLVYCIDEKESSIILEAIKSVNENNDCSNACFSENKEFIIEDKKCVEYLENSEVIDTKTIYLSDNLINTEKAIKYDISEYFQDETNKETTTKFSSEEFFKGGHIIEDESIKNKDKIIENIRKDLLNGNLNDLLFNLTNGTKQDLLFQSKDIIFQITTTENQKNNEYKNISTINLNLCEERLRSKNNISEDQTLIIFKVDYYVPGLLIPVIGYEVYHPTKNYKLELSNCSDLLIDLNIPISINEDTLFKYDPNSKYYTDECYSYTTESGTDIILNDRQNEYSDNNLSICESNCTLNMYDSETKKAICECHTKTKIDSISDIINNDNIISSNFNKNNSTTNFATMKCMNTLFSKEGLLENIGSYLFIFNLIFFSISAIIYFKCGNHLIENMLKQDKPIKKSKSQKLSIYNGKKKVKGRKRKKIKSNSMKMSHRMGNPLKRISKKSTDNPRTKYYKREMSEFICSKSILKNTNCGVLNYEQKEENEIKINKKEKDEIKMKKYKNCELNSFPYKKALLFDRRTFGQIYLYLLLIKQPILFSFFPNDDYNLTIIKISLFFLSFDIYLIVNAFFFSKSTIHQIYEDEGNYNLSYFFPQIIFSFFISYIFICLIKYFSLSENNILELKKNEEKIIRINEKIEKVRK